MSINYRTNATNGECNWIIIWIQITCFKINTQKCGASVQSSLVRSLALCAVPNAFGCFQVTLNALNIWLSTYCCAIFCIANRFTPFRQKVSKITATNRIEFNGYTNIKYKIYNKSKYEANIEIINVKLFFMPEKERKENKHIFFFN